MMKKVTLAALAILLIAVSPLLAEEPQAEEPQAEEPQAEEPQAEEPQTEEPQAEEPQTAETQTLHGEFVWERTDKDVSGPIEVIFESTGEAAWNVAFHFSFDDEKHIYAGTAEGSLTEGRLHGRVMTDGDEPSPFEFEGTFTEGTFQGTHTSYRDAEPQPTGTLTFRR